MGPVFYVMAILGCGEADTACQPVAQAQAQYQSIDACNAATADEIMSRSDLAFPVVVAQCQRADQSAAQQLRASDVDLPDAKRQPKVQRAAATKPVRLARS
jgi:hypothetical protein